MSKYLTDGADTYTAAEGEYTIYGLDGDDIIFSSVQYVANLYGGEGYDDLNYDDDATGVAYLYGGGGADTIDGGSNADYLGGDDGNDTLTGSGGGDEIYGGTGDDKLYGYYTYDSTRDGADKLYGGGGDDELYGQKGGDILEGGEGADILSGGTGNDFLTGGKNADRFLFTSKVNSTGNVDRISDFTHLTDELALKSNQFSALGSSVTTGEFRSASNASTAYAHDDNDYLIYNRSTGQLYYDQDGAGGEAKVLFAELQNNPDNLSYNDFQII